MLVVKGSPLAVDGHGQLGVKVHVLQLGDGATLLHVGGVATGTENAANLDARVGVGGSDHGTGRVVDQSGKLDGYTTLFESGLEAWYDVNPLHAGYIEALGPPLENSVVDSVLRDGV